MGKPDALSHRADHGSGSQDNDNITLLDPSLFRIHALSGVVLEGEERCVLRDIKRSLQTSEPLEPAVKAARDAIKSHGCGLVRSNEWTEHEGLLLYRGKVYVPHEYDLCRRIVAQHHDSQIAGHPGRWKMLELISRHYWWPQMSRYVGLYIKTCDPCMRTKIQRHQPIGELHHLDIPHERWDTISVDFVVELPEAHGYDAILNVVNLVSKRAHFLPTHTTIMAEGAANLFYRHVWCHHGLPRRVVSDCGSQFVADFMTELYRLLGITVALSTAYHPQTDGQTERVNQELEQYLRLFTNEQQSDWDDYLPLGEFSYNNHVHLSMQQTPFLLDTGCHPRMGFEPLEQRSAIEAINEFTDCMAKGLEEAKAALTRAQDEYAKYYDRCRLPAPMFKVGDKVWLDASDIHTTRPLAKLAHRRLGPYKIEKAIGHGSYRLHLPPSLSYTPYSLSSS
jgi:Integrase zinc binding domain